MENKNEKSMIFEKLMSEILKDAKEVKILVPVKEEEKREDQKQDIHIIFRIQGVTIEIGGNITKFLKALSGMKSGNGSVLLRDIFTVEGILTLAGTAFVTFDSTVGIAVVLIGGIGLVVIVLWKNCDGFREDVSNIWSKVMSVFLNGINVIKNRSSNVVPRKEETID